MTNSATAFAPVISELSWQPPKLPRSFTRQQLGAWGEELATRFLQARGAKILERNWRVREGEIDIIYYSPQRRAIIACEVKTRREHSFVGSIEAVSRSKYERLRLLLTKWLESHEHHAPHIYIDLIAITVVNPHSWDLNHIEAIA